MFSSCFPVPSVFSDLRYTAALTPRKNRRRPAISIQIEYVQPLPSHLAYRRCCSVGNSHRQPLARARLATSTAHLTKRRSGGWALKASDAWGWSLGAWAIDGTHSPNLAQPVPTDRSGRVGIHYSSWNLNLHKYKHLPVGGGGGGAAAATAAARDDVLCWTCSCWSSMLRLLVSNDRPGCGSWPPVAPSVLYMQREMLGKLGDGEKESTAGSPSRDDAGDL